MLHFVCARARVCQNCRCVDVVVSLSASVYASHYLLPRIWYSTTGIFIAFFHDLYICKNLKKHVQNSWVHNTLTASHSRYDIQHVFSCNFESKPTTRYASRKKLFRTTTYLFDNFVANSTLSECVSFAANSRWSAGIAWSCQWQPDRNRTCEFRWPRVSVRLYDTFRETVT